MWFRWIVLLVIQIHIHMIMYILCILTVCMCLYENNTRGLIGVIGVVVLVRSEWKGDHVRGGHDVSVLHLGCQLRTHSILGCALFGSARLGLECSELDSLV